MVCFGIGKRGERKGVWYVSKGLESVSLRWTRNGRIYDEEHLREGRTYIYPEEGDTWEFTYYYFDKVTKLEEYQFKKGNFYKVSQNYWKPFDFRRNTAGETVKMNELVVV